MFVLCLLVCHYYVDSVLVVGTTFILLVEYRTYRREHVRSEHHDAQMAENKELCLSWIEGVLGEKIPRDQPFEKVLKDGIILCNMINKIQPGSVKRINKKGSNFVLMENHAAYQKAVKKYGVPDEEIFQTVDLFEARNIKQVVKSIFALGRICQNKGYEGPTLGPKMAEKQERHFTEEQLRAGRQGHIGLQAGSNKGASQAGISMGKNRMILD